MCLCVGVEERCWRHPFHEHFFCWRRSSAPLRWLKKKGNQVTYLYMHTGPIHAQSTYSCIIINIDIWEYPRYTRHTMSAQPNKRPFIVKVRFMSKKGKLLSAPHIWDTKTTTYTQKYYDDAYYNTESIWSFMHRVVDQCIVLLINALYRFVRSKQNQKSEKDTQFSWKINTLNIILEHTNIQCMCIRVNLLHMTVCSRHMTLLQPI